VLPFQRPAPPETGATPGGGSDLELLDGVGPGLIWALRRAGIPDLASVAALEPEALAARLGPLGRLVPARAWVEAARGGA
jgi:predicted flap endonuclease-1-like 5' DNA nuclease